MAKGAHYTVDEKQRNVLITEDGCAHTHLSIV